MRCRRLITLTALRALLVSVLASPGLAMAQVSGPATDDALTAELRSQIQSHKRSIAALDGTYGDASAELYLSLARAYRELGDYTEAAAAYKESLQALRIMLGLDSEEQLDTLAEYNAILLALEDWQQIDTNFHLANHIAAKLYDKVDSRYIQTATQLASWKIQAFESGVYRADDDRSIQEAARIYAELAAALPESSSDYHSLRADYLSAKGLAHFYSAKYVADLPLDSFNASVPGTGGQQQCYSLVMSFDGPQPARSACPDLDLSNPEMFTAQQRTKNDTVRRHLADMRGSFADAIESIENDPSASARKLALAILNLGDANLLAQDYARAKSQYARAWQLLSQDGESIGLRDQLLGQPEKVMTGVLDEVMGSAVSQESVLIGTVEFDVTENGAIENIAMQGPEATFEQDNIGAIAIKLDQTTFRPKLVDGKPVRSRISLLAAEL